MPVLRTWHHWNMNRMFAGRQVFVPALILMSNNIEVEFQLVPHSHQTVKRLSGFHFVFVTAYAEFSLLSKVITRYCALRRHCDLPAKAMQDSIASDFEILLAAILFSRHVGAAKYN